jgi:hypothetical protein
MSALVNQVAVVQNKVDQIAKLDNKVDLLISAVAQLRLKIQNRKIPALILRYRMVPTSLVAVSLSLIFA